MADLAIRQTYAARIGEGLITDVIRELQEADEQQHGVDAKAVFSARNKGWQVATRGLMTTASVD